MKTMINIKADVLVKKRAQALAEDLGLPLSGVINAFLKEFIRNKSIAFSSVPRMSPMLENTIALINDDIRKGKNLSPVFYNAKEMNDYLDTL